MNVTFKDKVLSLYRRTIYKRPWLKIPMMALSVILLSLDRLAFNLKNRAGKYVAVVMALTFAFISCSFSSVIWGDGEYDFTDEAAALYEYETEESAAALAVETDIDSYDLDDDDDYDGLADPETLEDISSIDTVSGADIVDNMDGMQLAADMSESGDEASYEAVFSKDDWQIVLINKNHPIPDDYTFTLGTIKGSMQCDERIIPDLYSMIEAAYADGVNLVICSPYRNDERQQMLFDRKVNNYIARGMSYMEAYRMAAQAVTIPGSSEHQVGLALDIVSDGYSSLNEGFGDTAAGKWLAEHSYEYGFVIRYPAGKEHITGIEYEPWHLRFVGRNAARVLKEENLTLEEFWEKYL